jgi:hypothetical protein
MYGQPRSGHGADDRGMATEVRVNPPQSRFGRIFDLAPRPDVAPFPEDLGMPGGPMDGGMGYRDNPAIPAVMTYFGQFVDHDLTLDTTSSLERQNDPTATTNFRTPVLELDNLYGLGPAVSPFLYDQRPTHALKMLLGPSVNHAAEVDLPRDSQGVALIGDPRNDENLVVAQLHVAFLKLHNAMVDQLPRVQDSIKDASAFDKVQRLVRWHYQWLILHHFLPAVAGQDVVDAVWTGKRQLSHSFVRSGLPSAQQSLAVRNLQRGVTMGLPSGQVIAQLVAPQIGTVPLTDAELWVGTPFSGQPAPLWYYLLREAEVRQHGLRLGPVGARIVEVLLGLLELDDRSFLVQAPTWRPVVEGRAHPDDFTFVDLFRIAGADIA